MEGSKERVAIREANESSKLGVLQRLMGRECKSRCVQVGRKSLRWILAKLRGGTAELRVESGRWIGLSREESIEFVHNVAQEKWKM